MAWKITLKPDQIITVNGCRIKVRTTRNIDLIILDLADIVLPNGTVKPKPDQLPDGPVP